jgi:hypothetical protein
MCDWSLGTHKSMHSIWSLNGCDTHGRASCGPFLPWVVSLTGPLRQCKGKDVRLNTDRPPSSSLTGRCKGNKREVCPPMADVDSSDGKGKTCNLCGNDSAADKSYDHRWRRPMPPEERPRIGRLMRRRPRIQGCERPRAACCVSQVWRRGERLIDLFFFRNLWYGDGDGRG